MNLKELIDWFNDHNNIPTIAATLDFINGDGHQVFSPDDFDMLPEEIRKHFTTEQQFANRSRYTTRLKGIYGLDVVERLSLIHI